MPKCECLDKCQCEETKTEHSTWEILTGGEIEVLYTNKKSEPVAIELTGDDPIMHIM